MPSFDPREIGSFVTPVAAIAPILMSAGTATPIVIDRAAPGGGGLFLSGVLCVNVGLATGTPDSFTVAAKVQHSEVSGSGGVDLAGAAITTATTAGLAQVNFALDGAKRYLTVVLVSAFVNGTSPKIPVSATIILGGSQEAPI